MSWLPGSQGKSFSLTEFASLIAQGGEERDSDMRNHEGRSTARLPSHRTTIYRIDLLGSCSSDNTGKLDFCNSLYSLSLSATVSLLCSESFEISALFSRGTMILG